MESVGAAHRPGVPGHRATQARSGELGMWAARPAQPRPCPLLAPPLFCSCGLPVAGAYWEVVTPELPGLHLSISTQVGVPTPACWKRPWLSYRGHQTPSPSTGVQGSPHTASQVAWGSPSALLTRGLECPLSWGHRALEDHFQSLVLCQEHLPVTTIKGVFRPAHVPREQKSPLAEHHSCCQVNLENTR